MNRGELPVLEEHLVTIQEQMEEEMFLGLRKTEGVSFARFKEFSVEMTEIFTKSLEQQVKKGLLEIEDESCAFDEAREITWQ